MPKEGSAKGLVAYESGEVLFNARDKAESLFIIQKGQIRLYIPKGAGFVDIAILRSGEVIGEMAYFYGEKAKTRSCSAAAVSESELIEIPFKKFENTLKNLNPWFKTIIETLAGRVRNANSRIKELESNSVGYSKGGADAQYTFFHFIEIVRALAYFYMVFKSQADTVGKELVYDRRKLNIFLLDIFGFREVKLEEFIELMSTNGYLEVKEDENDQPNILTIKNIELYRRLFMFFNAQRLKPDDKQLNIPKKCQYFLESILGKIQGTEPDKEGKVFCPITAMVEKFKAEKLGIEESDLENAVKYGYVGDVIQAPDGGLGCNVFVKELRAAWPSIKLMNAVKEMNESKQTKRY